MCFLKLGLNSFKGFKLTTWFFIGPFWIWQSLLLMLLIWASVGLKMANSPSLLSHFCSEVVYTLLQLVAEPIVSLGVFLWCPNPVSPSEMFSKAVLLSRILGKVVLFLHRFPLLARFYSFMYFMISFIQKCTVGLHMPDTTQIKQVRICITFGGMAKKDLYLGR